MLKTKLSPTIDHATAAHLSGILYGNILHRDADQEGYEFYVRSLQTGTLGVEDAVRRMFLSEEFYQKFVVNQTPNELARNLLVSFFGPHLVRPADITVVLSKLVNDGLPAVLDDLLDDPRMQDFHGQHPIPRYSEGATGKLTFQD
jgi:hypothetical protein